MSESKGRESLLEYEVKYPWEDRLKEIEPLLEGANFKFVRGGRYRMFKLIDAVNRDTEDIEEDAIKNKDLDEDTDEEGFRNKEALKQLILGIISNINFSTGVEPKEELDRLWILASEIILRYFGLDPLDFTRIFNGVPPEKRKINGAIPTPNFEPRLPLLMLRSEDIKDAIYAGKNDLLMSALEIKRRRRDTKKMVSKTVKKMQ